MLVLSRKTNQEILINGNIKVSVLKIKGNVVRIGIEAPAEVSIKRGELETQAIDLPVAETIDASAEAATFALSIDTETLEVSEGVAGFQLLPLPAKNSLADSQCAESAPTNIQAQFPETMQRGLCCDPVNSNQKSA